MLGEIVGAALCRPNMNLSHSGKIVREWVYKISDRYPYAHIDNHVIMPNHIHMLLSLGRLGGDGGRHDAAPTRRVTVGRIMGYFKYQTTKEIDIPGFWQRSYHDHIIRG